MGERDLLRVLCVFDRWRRLTEADFGSVENVGSQSLQSNVQSANEGIDLFPYHMKVTWLRSCFYLRADCCKGDTNAIWMYEN